MSSFTELRRQFYRDAIRYGLTENELEKQLKVVYPLGWGIETAKLSGWLHKLARVPEIVDGREQRLVNHFKIGADPEFVFSYKGQRMDAMRLGLGCGRAYGADSNGRLAEIRPFPSRSALEVVASIMSTMKWMYALMPECRVMEWLSGAHVYGDGIGGHVHFGRKRDSREAELSALDNVYSRLLELGIFPPNNQLMARNIPDAHGQVYGQLHDHRLQAHGYEYRAFPSWLDSPATAFIVLTFGKLAVHCPEIASRITNIQGLRNFLHYFKAVDDDARLACVMMARNVVPKYKGGDIRPRWVATASWDTPEALPRIVPLMIPPAREDIEMLKGCLLSGEPVKSGVLPRPTWSPTHVPKGFTALINKIETTGLRGKGLGELCWDLCVPDEFKKLDISGSDHKMIQLSTGLIDILPKDWRAKLKPSVPSDKVVGYPKESMFLLLGKPFRESKILPVVKRALLSGAFPIWKIGDATPEKYAAWRAGARMTKDEFTSKVLYKGRDGVKI